MGSAPTRQLHPRRAAAVSAAHSGAGRAHVRRGTGRTSRGAGFTLLEVLVALVIFGIITVALSFTFDTATKTQQSNIRRLEELGAVRSVFDYMTRDIQQAYASTTNPGAVFIAGGSTSGPQSSVSGGLLTLTTRTNRLVSDAPAGTSSATTGPVSAAASLPQSETAIVRYDFDPQARSVSRTAVSVPSMQALQQAPSGPENVISGLISEISLRFYDATAQTWRTDWDFEQQNQQAAATTAGGASTGTSGAAAGTAAAGASATATAATGDTTLPGAVEVTLTIHHQDNTTATYVANIGLVTSQAADGQAPPVNTPTTTSGGQSSGTGQ